MGSTALSSGDYLGFFYALIINILGFILMYLDKKYAMRGKKRIPEGMLLFFAAIGGSLGALAAMLVCHHKTRKPKFYIGVPVIIALQILLLILFCFVIKV